MECDNVATFHSLKPLRFQSTHSHGVRLLETQAEATAQAFQSTHSHGVRRIFGVWCQCNADISINALAWSATVFNFLVLLKLDISINALAWSATFTPPCQRLHRRHFNQRTRMECDGYLSEPCHVKGYFNQRTRMECDSFYVCVQCWKPYFNQRTRMECDTAFAPLLPCPTVFQSTHSHGVRLWQLQ